MTEMTMAQPDMTLLMDLDGIIRDASFSSAVQDETADTWLGRSWRETVTAPGGDAVERMIADARATGVSGFKQIVQRFPSGRELRFEFTTLMLGGKAGLMAIGKSLQAVADLEARLIAAQQALERDYWKLREVETRYRLLFEASTEAVLLLREANLRIIEANPAAIVAMGMSTQDPGRVVGREFLSELDSLERPAFHALLAGAREHGKSPGILVHLGQSRQPWLIRASLMVAEPGPVFLVQLTPAVTATTTVAKRELAATEIFIERSPDGFVVVDRDGAIGRSNHAFVDMVEVGSRDAVLGRRLGQWLSKPGADWSALLDNLLRHRRVRRFSTSIQGELGTERDVEISAVGDVDDAPRHIALMIRDVGGNRMQDHGDDIVDLLSLAPRAGLAALEGSSLRVLVDSTVGTVERHYLQSALEATSGNRKAAAELLGLSRQSLYAKINRYGLSDERRSEADEGE